VVRVSLKGLAARKLRLALTMLSVVLGVAFVSATFVFTDSITNAFDTLFHEVNQNTDVVIHARNTARGSSPDDREGDPNSRRMPGSILETIKAVPGVQDAVGSIAGNAQLVDKSGKPIGGHGPPTLGFSWGTNRTLSALRLIKGRAPRGPGEVVIDTVSAKKHHLSIGDDVQVVFERGDGKFRIVGYTGFGTSNQTQGATLAAFDVATARRIFHTGGRIDVVLVQASRGESSGTLRRRIDEALPSRYTVLTGSQSAQEQINDIKKGIGFLTNAMLGFAFVSLFVGAFTIFNTFSIVVAQRSRELGLLRALGATRRQVVAGVVAEGFVVGIVCSLTGIVAGIGLAYLLRWGLDAAGITFPKGGFVLHPRTIIVSLIVGVGVTFVSSIIPALRASRVAPIEALREVGPQVQGMRKRMIVFGLLVWVGGALLLGIGLFGSRGLQPTAVLLGAGFVVLIIGTALLAPLLVRPAVHVLGWPARHIGGVPGSLASKNAARNPRRTAATAAALMIGVGLAGFAAIFTTSITHTVGNQIDRAFGADYLLSNKSHSGGLKPEIAGTVESLPEIKSAVGVNMAGWDLGSSRKELLAIDPSRLSDALKLQMAQGNADNLDPSTILVSDTEAKQHNWAVGDTITMKFEHHKTSKQRVAGVFKEIGLTDFVVAQDLFNREFSVVEQSDALIFVSRESGASGADARTAINTALKVTPYVQVQDQTDLKDEQKKQTDTLLSILFAMLGLSLIIALVGIVNTLALSIFERTRELGLLRAVGMTRWQIRRMITAEAVIIALVGALLGMLLGLSLGYSSVRALRSEGLEFAIPQGFVIVLVVVGIIAGLLSSILPARRAARLNVLDAIATD